MPAIYPKKASFSLTSDDETRLQIIAPLFNIEFRQIDEKTYVLSTNDGVHSCNVSLPAAKAHRRLFMEISARAAKWVHFHLGVSCRDSLLGQSDARLERIAALYALDHDTSRPNVNGERSSAQCLKR